MAERASRTGADRPEAPSVPAASKAGYLLALDQIGSDGPITALEAVPLGLQATILTFDGGEVYPEVTPHGEVGLRFPEWAGGEFVPRAVVRIAPLDGQPWPPWEPGEDDFVFGADFSMDDERTGVPTDDGDNLLQRGIASEPSQFKLEVDQRRTSCRVAGHLGVVEVRSQVRVAPGTWHRAECERRGGTVSLRVSEWQGSSFVQIDVAEATGVTGELSWSGATPLSVGGKLTPHGAIMKSATDQLNGAIARPFLGLEPSDGSR